MPTELLPLEPYELALALLGLITLLAAWVPTRLFGHYSLMPLLYLAGGALIFATLDLHPVDPGEHRLLWEKLTELVVIISLLGAGLRIDTPVGRSLWWGPWRLLLISMPLTILATASLGAWLLGLPPASALLLGAVLAPTDPVMASQVQVGPPGEEAEHPVRFTLTAEAGLNDGLAFPFTYLAVGVALLGHDSGAWLWDWLWQDVVYRLTVGAATGVAVGWGAGRLIFRRPRKQPLAEGGMGVLGLAVVLLVYGAAETVGGYGFIAAFVAGLTLRRVEFQHTYNHTLHTLSENLEQALMGLILVMLGGISPGLLGQMNGSVVLLALSIILLVRPLTGFIGLLGYDWPWRSRAVAALFGIRGIGSLYYLAYALGHAEFPRTEQLWATVALIIWLSTTLHGLGAPLAMGWLERAGE